MDEPKALCLQSKCLLVNQTFEYRTVWYSRYFWYGGLESLAAVWLHFGMQCSLNGTWQPCREFCAVADLQFCKRGVLQSLRYLQGTKYFFRLRKWNNLSLHWCPKMLEFSSLEKPFWSTHHDPGAPPDSSVLISIALGRSRSLTGCVHAVRWLFALQAGYLWHATEMGRCPMALCWPGNLPVRWGCTAFWNSRSLTLLNFHLLRWSLRVLYLFLSVFFCGLELLLLTQQLHLYTPLLSLHDISIETIAAHQQFSRK